MPEFSQIFTIYYQNLIDSFENKDVKKIVRILFEDKLIDFDSKRRVSLDEIIITNSGITSSILTKLIDSHLVRSEPNSLGGRSYELSHDTLVEPIRKIKEIRIEEEKRNEELRVKSEELKLLHEQQEKERIERHKERSRQKTIIMIVSIAAIISISLGIFGLWQMKIAKNALDESQKQTLIAVESLEKVKNSYIQAATLYFQNGEYKVALEKYEYLRDTLMQGQTTQAIEVGIKKCNEKIIDNKLYDSLMAEAEIYLSKSDYENTIENYKQAIETKINNEEVIILLKEILTAIEKEAQTKRTDAIYLQSDNKKQNQIINEAIKLENMANKIKNIIENH